MSEPERTLLLEPVHNLEHRPHVRGMRKTYPSDISREQFEFIRPYLDGLRKATRPREVDLYEVFCAVLYVLDSGCQWRMLPGDFPKWRTVYFYWSQWRERNANSESPLDIALKKSGRRPSTNPESSAPDAISHC